MARVRLSLAARADLRAYRQWLGREAGRSIADPWIDALIDWMAELESYPERGMPRADLGVGLRTRVFRRSVTIAYAVKDDQVTILGLFARGRNVTADAVTSDR